ncbi:hypothetical protein J4457_02225 [Candidatus Woesearchaeota archaeon]|nr:hypothetical protein [Candidatus Woesearchaeota archaeon]
MDTALIVILSLIGLGALYWVLFGQWKFNKMVKETQEKIDDLGKEPPKAKL